ncbi:MAG: L-threonylcarbamoyladenylate synthase [Candidatus Binatia bacterium]
MSKTEIANSKVISPRVEDFYPAIEALTRGDVIVFPTETLYGLGADALNEAAVAKVLSLKGREADNPISVLVANQSMLRSLVTDIPAAAQLLMNRYWPGPLTLVLPGRKDIPKPLSNPAGGIAVRISSQPIATLLVRALGRPVTATSANPSGKEPARTLQEAKRYFVDQIHLYVDGGTLTSKSGSTVLEVMENRFRIIREGEISAFELETVLGRERIQK